MLFKKKNSRTLDPTMEDSFPVATLEPVGDGESMEEESGDGYLQTESEASDELEEAGAEADGAVVVDENDSATDQDDLLLKIKSDIHRRVIGQIDLSTLGTMEENELRVEIRKVAERLVRDSSNLLNLEDRERLVNEVVDETFGLGPLEPLFRDPTISDILINGPKTVYIESGGRLRKSSVRFANEAHLLKIVQRIASEVGRRVDETSPMVDARLADGSRINAIIPPLAIDGTLVSIRRFGSHPLQAADLMRNDSITPEMLEFLQACMKARLNVLISGGTGSGKTTLLNVLSGYISHDERVATIEDAAELQLQQPHVIRMETRPANVEGTGAVTTRDLVKNALRMRPDRIIVGECRGAEALDMLQAMNTGHDGSLTTVHANTPRDAVARLEMMVGMTGFDLPMWTIRRQIASAVDIVIQAIRLTGGPRKIVRVSEITGMEGEVISMHDVFEFKQTGVDENLVARGYFAATGIRPRCLERLACVGIDLAPDLFEKRILSR